VVSDSCHWLPQLREITQIIRQGVPKTLLRLIFGDPYSMW